MHADHGDACFLLAFSFFSACFSCLSSMLLFIELFIVIQFTRTFFISLRPLCSLTHLLTEPLIF